MQGRHHMKHLMLRGLLVGATVVLGAGFIGDAQSAMICLTIIGFAAVGLRLHSKSFPAVPGVARSHGRNGELARKPSPPAPLPGTVPSGHATSIAARVA